MTSIFALFLTLALFVSPALAAGEEWIQFEPVEFSIHGGQALEAFESALEDMHRLSSTFRPTGAAISRRNVQLRGPRGVPRISFDARHGFDIFQKSERIHADITTKRGAADYRRRGARYDYRIQVTTMDSDHLVAANVAALEVILYAEQLPGGGPLNIVAHGRMKKGYSYGRFAGPAIRDLIQAQINPLLEAL